jgi:hypothetical protein
MGNLRCTSTLLCGLRNCYVKVASGKHLYLTVRLWIISRFSFIIFPYKYLILLARNELWPLFQNFPPMSWQRECRVLQSSHLLCSVSGPRFLSGCYHKLAFRSSNSDSTCWIKFFLYLPIHHVFSRKLTCSRVFLFRIRINTFRL